MNANSFGSRFVVHTFGESHGPALGAVTDGCPAGVDFDETLLLKDLARRRPGQVGTSARQEMDTPEILSGVFEGKTLGTPIAMIIRNTDARPQDYRQIATSPRAGHADDVWKLKYEHVDPRGGGRSSGRETVARVMGGAVAKMFLRQTLPHLKIRVYADQIGEFILNTDEEKNFLENSNDIDAYAARFPSPRHEEIKAVLLQAQEMGESFGGSAKIVIQGVPSGLGQPVFHKLKADFASAFMSVGATSGFEIGEGQAASADKGTIFHSRHSSVYGGIRGGISTGEPLTMRVSFKPTSSLLDVAKKGRHDPCIVIRAIPVLEAMAALVLADHWLWTKTDRV